jgi:hypothetical protein
MSWQHLTCEVLCYIMLKQEADQLAPWAKGTDPLRYLRRAILVKYHLGSYIEVISQCRALYIRSCTLSDIGKRCLIYMFYMLN